MPYLERETHNGDVLRFGWQAQIYPNLAVVGTHQVFYQLLLSMNTSVAVPIYFHTIVSNVHARLDAYICHNNSAAHEIVMKGDALIHAKFSRIRPPTMVYLRFCQ